MATNFPTSLDTFTNPNSGNTLDSPSHSVQHSDINDAVEAIEAKLGVGSSTAGSATAGYALVNTSGGTTAYSLLGVSGLSSGTAVADTVLTADGSGAATFLTLPSAGLTLINTTSFTTTATINLAADIFSSTYRNYRIVLDITAIAAVDGILGFRMRAAGVDESGSNYVSISQVINQSGASAAFATTSGTIGYLVNLDGGNLGHNYGAVMDFLNPYGAIPTLIIRQGFGVKQDGTTYEASIGNVLHNVSTSYDSLTLLSSGGTNLTGQIQIFGYNQ
jgi:hypothetical protein